ncbi:MCM-domain-containing protein [Rhizoclosmatium globosum]|uniref:DNA helicase n=1 Tax=Rhizoclosmatium globosum TaxID=329046 RepID=A0A1Y2CUN0_9FUNG|nr:MCM-domain-containing protein [Rhizoclosmatium globosum]|eukprot:ORY50759.1 MCM-domain-containing protein [Rhizoclosmatium globosum]
MKRTSQPQPPQPTSKRSRATATANSLVPFAHWSLYFPGELYDDAHELAPTIRAFNTFFADLVAKAKQLGEPIKRSQLAVTVNYIDIKTKTQLDDLDERIKIEPTSIIAALGLAFSNALIQEYGNNLDRIKRQVRVIGYDQITPLKDLKANLMGRFISVRGTIVRVSSIKPVVTQIAFECTSCLASQVLEQIDGKYRVPSSCTGNGCRGKTFVPERSGLSETRTVDWQRIRIQEKLPDDQKDSGRIPRTVECELTEDLVDLVVPGDVVCVTGIVKVLETQEGKFKQKGAHMYYLYISANSLMKASGSSDAEQEDDNGNGFSKDSVAFTRKDLYGIRQIHEVGGEELFKLLVNSLCPAIFGHETVKAGLLLALFGGRKRTLQESKDIEIRSNPHVLVVGDPGLGKSQMLSAVVKAAPRGVYVCGNTTTTSGLTVTLCKDGDSGESGLEAGALVLGDRGVCCIDEFDKLTEHQALLEAMEQQSISIAKAGMVCTLPARTSVIAAANPVGGHYNKAKTVAENLKMNTALLSRFDLVFILLDKPDEQMDKFLSDHIMKLHSGQNSNGKPVTTAWGKDGSSTQSGSQEPSSQNTTLQERLKVTTDDFDPIPLSLLRKYIAYSKKYVQPIFDADYHQTLESMMRLVEARARSELRDEATRQDALDVVSIMKFSLWETYEDELGNLDFQRSQHGSGTSKKGEEKRFMTKLSRVATETGLDKFNYDQLHEIAKEMALRTGNFKDFVETLNHQGYLLKKGNRLYSIAL